MICLNSNISVRNNQTLLQEYLNIVNWLDNSQCESYSNSKITTRFTNNREALLRFILSQVINWKRAFPSHESMQLATGMSRSAVIRALKVFESMKIIAIDHRNLLHLSNIYSLGEVFRNATVVRYLSDKFKEIVPAFCRTMERLGNLMFGKKLQPVYTGYFKSNATPSTNVDVFVVSNTNTNTSTMYYKTKKESKVMNQKQENYQKLREKYPEKKEVEYNPGYMAEQNKIAIANTAKTMDLDAQIRECMNEAHLPRRITLFKQLLPVVHRASVPYIEFLIRKYTKKLDPFSDRF